MNYLIYNIASLLNFLSETHAEIFGGKISATNSQMGEKINIQKDRNTHTHTLQTKREQECANVAKY